MDPLGNRAEMPWIPVHQNWQTNLLWPMDPPSELSIDAQNTATPNLAHEPTLANGPPPPSELRIDVLNTATPNVADKPTLANGPPSESRIDVLNTATPNLADKPTVANATDIYWSRMAISHGYWHPVVKNGNFSLLLTSSGPAWQFHNATDI